MTVKSSTLIPPVASCATPWDMAELIASATSSGRANPNSSVLRAWNVSWPSCITGCSSIPVAPEVNTMENVPASSLDTTSDTVITLARKLSPI